MPPLELTNPVPIASFYNFIPNTWSIQFDQPLVPGPIAAGAFTWRENAGNQDRAGTIANAMLDTVSGTAAISGATARPNGAYFVDLAGDLFGVNGLPVLSFQGFPTIFA